MKILMKTRAFDYHLSCSATKAIYDHFVNAGWRVIPMSHCQLQIVQRTMGLIPITEKLIPLAINKLLKIKLLT